MRRSSQEGSKLRPRWEGYRNAYLSRSALPRAIDAVQPCTYCIERVITDVGILPAASGRNVKAMICIFECVQGGARAEALDERSEQTRVGELIARTLNEEHGHADLLQV